MISGRESARRMEKLLDSECKDGPHADYIKSVFVEMNELRKEGCFCDVTIESDDGRHFEGHRIVLASSSSYFRAMFTHNMQESHQKVVRIRQVESRVMEELFTFAYTGKTKLVNKGQEFIESLLIASNMLQFQQVENACVDFIRENVTVKNYAKLRLLAKMHSQMALKRVLDEFIVLNFSKVAETPGINIEMYKQRRSYTLKIKTNNLSQASKQCCWNACLSISGPSSQY